LVAIVDKIARDTEAHMQVIRNLAQIDPFPDQYFTLVCLDIKRYAIDEEMQRDWAEILEIRLASIASTIIWPHSRIDCRYLPVLNIIPFRSVDGFVPYSYAETEFIRETTLEHTIIRTLKFGSCLGPAILVDLNIMREVNMTKY
jgi:hypothetical protein